MYVTDSGHSIVFLSAQGRIRVWKNFVPRAFVALVRDLIQRNGKTKTVPLDKGNQGSGNKLQNEDKILIPRLVRPSWRFASITSVSRFPCGTDCYLKLYSNISCFYLGKRALQICYSWKSTISDHELMLGFYLKPRPNDRSTSI